VRQLLGIIGLFFYLNSYSQEESAFNINLYRKIKEYKVYQILSNNNKHLVQEAKFKNGKISELTYNKDGLLTKEIFKYRNSFLIQKIEQQGEFFFIYNYVYDNLNRIIKETYQSKNGKILSKKIYCYSKDSIIINLIDYQLNSSSKEIKIYDKIFVHLISNELVYPNDSKIPSSNKYILYNESKLIKQENIEMNNIDFQSNYIYDSQKRLIKIIKYQNNVIASKVFITYSLLGYQSKEFSYISASDSILTKSDIITKVNGKINKSEVLNYYDTNEEDSSRLYKDSGEIIIYNDIGVSKISQLTAGKITGNYIVTYKL
jgi:hypothetical protein